MFAFLLGDTITYCQRLSRGNNIDAVVVPEEALYVEYGFLVPTGTMSWNTLDALDGTTLDIASHAWFVDGAGVVREIFVNGHQRFSRRLPSGPGVFYYRCEDVDMEKVILAAYDIAGDNPAGIVKAIRNTIPLSELAVNTIHLSKIRKRLARRKLKPLRFHKV